MSNKVFRQIKEKGRILQPELTDLRRRLHSNPELGFAEFETGEFIRAQITGLGLPVRTGIAKTGLTAFLERPGSRFTIALRADMDALPIDEKSDVPFKSTRTGVMHACGHDAHMAMLIGAARILSELRNELRVNVKFIFQPCEEQPRGGAEPMIKEGVLENPAVDAIFGLHVHPYLPSGFLGIKEGTVMAAADQFELKITGQGGHGASPHQTVDPIFVSAHVIQALQAIVSRQTDPLEPVVVSVGSIHGGSSFNIIPEQVRLTGTVRTLNPRIQEQIPDRIRGVVKGIASAYGAHFDLDYQWGYPVLVNNSRMLEMVRRAGRDIIGSHRVLTVETPTMGAEDFACFTGRVPGAYFFLGVRPPSGEAFPWHNPRFDLDESALSVGASVLAGCVLHAQLMLLEEEVRG